MGKKTVLPVIRILIVGSSDVGKYSLGQQYAKGWIEPKKTTATEGPSKVIQQPGGKYEVKVVVCRNLEGDQMQGCDGVVLVYSVTDKNSFTYAKTAAFQKLHERYSASPQTSAGSGSMEAAADDSADNKDKLQEIAETPTGTPTETGLNVPIILVGNKIDDAKLARQIETDVGEALSRDLSCVGFFETAAPCNAGVPKAFECLLTEIINKRINSKETKGRKKSPANACCIIS